VPEPATDRQLDPGERMLLDSFTDDEWLSVMQHCDPSADVRTAIDHVIARREEDHRA
jgi:hypothetical protein